MGMASRALSPLVPSWFRPRHRHRHYSPSPFQFPEAARGTERRRPLEEQYKRLIAELRPPRSPAPPDPSQVLAYETEKRRWINEQKRLIAEAMRRSGGPDPRWDENDRGGKDDSRKRRTVVIEELSAYEIKKRRWMEQHKRSIARATRLAAFEEAWGHRRARAQPVVPTTETAGDPAKRPCDRFGPGSDAAFLKSVLDDQKSDGGVERDSGQRWTERDEAHNRRQRYLRDYCPFQREEESVLEEEEKKRTEPVDDAEIEPSVPVSPSNGPAGSVDAEFSMNSDIQKNENPPWVGRRRRSEEYYAMRRQVLQSFKFVTDESEKAGAGVAPRSACTTGEEASEESVPEKRKQEEPDDAEIEGTVTVLPANGPESSMGAESSMASVICRRGDEGYNAMRREVLQSFNFVTDESEKADAGVAPRSPCATRRRRSGMFLRSVLGFARVPAAAKTCWRGRHGNCSR